jgi:hemerythrin-like domain-containing protein
MKPRGPLMIEHRLIEKMLVVIKDQMSVMRKQNRIDSVFIDAAVDFIRTYADKTHHGKEEDILFRDLATKNISAEDKKAMQELVEEHKFARKKVAELVQAKEDYLAGRKEALKTVLDTLTTLVEFYPEHIRREDEAFFPDTEKYFTRDELDAMLLEFWEFDKKMIHEKYKSVVEYWKGMK